MSALGSINYIWLVIANTYRNKTTPETHLKFFYNDKEVMYIENKNEENRTLWIVFKPHITVDQRLKVFENIQKVFDTKNIYLSENSISLMYPKEEDLLVLIYACFYIYRVLFLPRRKIKRVGNTQNTLKDAISSFVTKLKILFISNLRSASQGLIILFYGFL